MDNIDLKLLRAFVVFMTEKSVSRAAERLGVSQPAASHSLARLRELFGDPLLLRSRGVMVPTERAISLEVAVRRMLGDYDEMLSDRRTFDPAQSRRTFIMSAPEYAEHLLMPGIAKRLRHDAPGVRIEIRAPDRDRGYELLESGQLDLRIAWLPQPPVSLRSMQLFQDRIVCIAHRDHPTIQGSLTLPQYLTAAHVRPLGSGRTTTGRVIDAAVERQGKGRKLDLALLVQSFLTIPFLMDGADLIATLPLKLAQQFQQQHPLQILETPLRLPRVRYAAYWHERCQKDPAHRWLRGIIADTAAAVAVEPTSAAA
ncbi:LysR family transcriptional regulator [Variovorax sp. J22R115]|uniref:LysR family transcriptional regulator n=1 Tax=Variovorax sp. J22R115 TaxID=3053509 RepID=UPI00257837A3|nr:LysR family transcriptional regulator [Variovorax sp. J22R115]MDM0053590.1 LysR family transcriptional regulator [Variovorax sp. J22R115]